MAVAQINRSAGQAGGPPSDDRTPLVDRITQQVASKTFRERLLEQGVIASGFFGALSGSVLGALGKVTDVPLGFRFLGGFFGGIGGLISGGVGGIVTSKVKEMMAQSNITPFKRGLIGAAGGSALVILTIVALEANGGQHGVSLGKEIAGLLEGGAGLIALFGGGGFMIGYCIEGPVPAMLVGASAGGAVGGLFGAGVGVVDEAGAGMGTIVGLGVGAIVTAAHSITGCLSPMITGHHVMVPNAAAAINA